MADVTYILLSIAVYIMLGYVLLAYNCKPQHFNGNIIPTSSQPLFYTDNWFLIINLQSNTKLFCNCSNKILQQMSLNHCIAFVVEILFCWKTFFAKGG